MLRAAAISLVFMTAGAAVAGEKLTSGSFTMELPLGLQAGSVYIPESNPMSPAKIGLGKLLYFDARLSKDKTVACASCHNPYHGFADPSPTSKGVGQLLGGRNSPTVINRLFSKEQFWDGRAADLEEQAKGPIGNPVEMAMTTLDVCVDTISKIKGYAPLFKAAFGDEKVTIDRIAQAIASYERTVVSGNSRYDRYQAGEKEVLSESAMRGMLIFNGKANCKVCHAGFNFTDESYHNLGVGMKAAKPDLGRSEISKADTDKGGFKTPTLRDVARTAPYMHDGSEATLKQVIEFYNKGGNPNPSLSKEMKPLALSARDMDDLVAFLEALNGEIPGDHTPPTTFPQ